MLIVFTMGHSNRTAIAFHTVLAAHGVDTVCDVRSVPFSRRYPHFNRNALDAALNQHGIRYVFLGAELGARTRDPVCLVDGRVDYARLAATPEFATGIQRVLELVAAGRRPALLCAERDPLDCHRGILIAPALQRVGLALVHLHDEHTAESHADFDARLLGRAGVGADLFATDAAALVEAYRVRGARLAWRPPSDVRESATPAAGARLGSIRTRARKPRGE